MALECASHPLPWSSFHQIHTPHGRIHCNLTETVSLHLMFLEIILFLFSTMGKHQCPSSVSFTTAKRSLCRCLLSGVAAVGCVQAQRTIRAIWGLTLMQWFRLPPPPWVRPSSYSSIQRKKTALEWKHYSPSQAGIKDHFTSNRGWMAKGITLHLSSIFQDNVCRLCLQRQIHDS